MQKAYLSIVKRKHLCLCKLNSILFQCFPAFVHLSKPNTGVSMGTIARPLDTQLLCVQVDVYKNRVSVEIMGTATWTQEMINLNVGESYILHIGNFREGFTFKKIKVRKVAKISNRYNQVPRLSTIPQGIVTKTQVKITNEIQEVSPFPAGDYKAAMSRCESMTNTRHK